MCGSQLISLGKRVKGFTLVELLLVVGIIAILGTVLFAVVNPVAQLQKSRDARRKQDLKIIRQAIEEYAIDNGGKYPPVLIPSVTPPVDCSAAQDYGYGNCYLNSTTGENWFPAISPYLKKVPRDPINNAGGPWSSSSNNYSYSYGNVCKSTQGSGQGSCYDLTTRLENPDDPDRCGFRGYRFYYSRGFWCKPYSDTSTSNWTTWTTSNTYSQQVYENSPGTDPTNLN